MRLIIDKVIEEKGVTQRFIAKKIGVNENTLGNWMTGKTWPKLNQAVDLADVLNCDVTDLYIRTD